MNIAAVETDESSDAAGSKSEPYVSQALSQCHCGHRFSVRRSVFFGVEQDRGEDDGKQAATCMIKNDERKSAST